MTEDTPAAEPPGLPPLRIHHFFAWSALAAAALTVNALATRAGESTVSEPGGYRIVGITAGSAALAALAVVVLRGPAVLRRCWQPGHGLLLMLSLSFAYGEVLRLMLALTSGGRLPSWYQALIWSYHLSFLVAGVACAIAMRKRLAWLWFFILWAAAPILWAVGLPLLVRLASATQIHLIALGLGLLPYLPCGLLMLLALLRERQEHVSRHWTHWCGVLIWWATFVAYSLSFAYYATVGAPVTP